MLAAYCNVLQCTCLLFCPSAGICLIWLFLLVFIMSDISVLKPKQKILVVKSRRDFLRVQRDPAFKVGDNDMLILAKNIDLVDDASGNSTKNKLLIPNNAFRFGLVVTKKIDKRAVIRNKIKRKLREMVRQLSREEPCKLFRNRMDYIIIARSSFLSNPHSYLVEEMRGILLKIGEKYEKKYGNQSKPIEKWNTEE